MKNRIGIIGGGQLGRMLTLAAKKLAFEVRILDPTPNSPAGQVADEQIVARYDDLKAVQKLAERSDYLTFEIELADDQILETLANQGTSINPAARTLRMIKDKLKQKEFLHQTGIPVARFRAVTTEAEIKAAAADFGYPLVLKARVGGYDGRGNILLKNHRQIPPALNKLGSQPVYVEAFVPFTKEVAVMVARNQQGRVIVYPVVETVHHNHICHLVLAPAPISLATAARAHRLAQKTAQHLVGAGVFGIEMFVTPEGKVLVNELAPRVHNSGHYTNEACATSQFEQHIRAITGLPLGSPKMIVPAAVMINILGEKQGPAQVTGLDQVLALPNVSVHLYGKAETKPERKMGHITVTDHSLPKALAKARKARKFLTI